MKKLFILLWLIMSVSNMAYAKKTANTLIGTVSNVECGDNCYLTIVDDAGKEHQALCVDDKPCEAMMMGIDGDFGGYKGKKVKVTLGKDKQYDGAGNVMGEMPSFRKIDLLH